MGFAEALSDGGSMTGRGSPWLRDTETKKMDLGSPIWWRTLM
jgi:hypothetical protein